MDALLRRFYSPRSERFDPTQLFLFGQLVDQMPLNEKAIEQEAGEKLVTRRARHKHGRNKLPDHLPRQVIEHDLTDEQKRCSCCGEPQHLRAAAAVGLFGVEELSARMRAMNINEIEYYEDDEDLDVEAWLGGRRIANAWCIRDGDRLKLSDFHVDSEFRQDPAFANSGPASRR